MPQPGPDVRSPYPRPTLTGLLPLLGALALGQCSWAQAVQTWDDFLPGTPVSFDKRSGTHFLESASVIETAAGSACSGSRYLSKSAPAPLKDGTLPSDPGPLTLVFDAPQAEVALCVGNPDGTQPREFVLHGFARGEFFKPAATTRITLPPGTPFGHTLRLCGALEGGFQQVQLWAGNDALEAFDDLSLLPASGALTNITFEEYAAGTLVERQFSGVHFPGRPEIVSSPALGIATHSGSQALRQRIAGESDPGPLVLQFNPAQGSIRLWTGYPPGEKQTGPLTVRLRAYGGSAKAPTLLDEQELQIPAPEELRHALQVCRAANDITRLELQFLSAFGGHEVIDDLEFGPNPVPLVQDLTPPVLRITAPAHGTEIAQPSSRPEHRTTTVTLRGVILEDHALSRLGVQLLNETGAVRVDLGDQMGLVHGNAPDFSFDLPILLEYGDTVIRLTAEDAVGHVSTLDHSLSYRGPPPVEITGTTPDDGYAPVIFRAASASGPALSNAPVVVRMTGRHLNPETRFYLVAESRATVPPSAPDLVEVTPSSRAPDGTSVELPLPEDLYRAPGRYAWLVWDAWSRPGAIPWTRATTFEARAWPHAALWSIGFRNRDETNEIGDFEGVYGRNVLPGFIEPTTAVGDCARGANAMQFFLDRYLPTVNARGAGGSCFGFAAASQFFATGAWRAESFDAAVRLPTGFLAPEPMRFITTGCEPETPANLWAAVQTMFGVHTSAEFLDSWRSQTRVNEAGIMLGNPLDAVQRLRLDPTAFVLAFTPFNTNVGHAVAPYRVEDRDANTVRIWVIDSNFPYNPALPEDDLANRMAVHRFVDVDRRSNSFQFSVGATADAALEYQRTNRMMGSALVALPMSTFANPRSIPMLDYLGVLYFGIAGGVEGSLEAEGAGTWSWDASSTFHGSLEGLSVVPSFAGAEGPAGSPLLLVPTNHTHLTLSLSGEDPEHQVTLGNGGVIFHARRKDRSPQNKDVYRIQSESGRPRALTFLPGSTAHSWNADLGLVQPGEGELLYRVHGARLEPGNALHLQALAEERGLRLHNDSPQAQHLHVELRGTTPKSAADHLWFGPFTLEPGATLELLPARWPDLATLQVGVDADADGQPESVTPTPGRAFTVKPGDPGDCNRNGRLDAADLALGFSTDLNFDGTPDDCTGTGEAPPATCPPDGTLDIAFTDLADDTVPSAVLGFIALESEARIAGGALNAAGPLGDSSLVLRFECARDTVTLHALNPSKSVAVRARLTAFAGSDLSKPVATTEAVIPPIRGAAVPLTVCRPIDADITLVVLDYEGSAAESIAGLTHARRAARTTQRLDFEDRAAGTIILGHYPGVVFPDRPTLTQASALGVGANSGTQVLRKTSAGDSDPGPLTLRFDPPQAEVRLRVGYPLDESDGRPLRVVLRAYDGTKGSVLPVATSEVILSQPRALDRTLRVVLCEPAIREVQVQFVDRALGGFEAIDDLEFGPVPPPSAGPDTTAPRIQVTRPTSGTRYVQSGPEHPTGATTVVATLTEDRGLDRVLVIVRDATGAEFRRLDDSGVRLTGTVPQLRLEATVPLAYGRNTVEIQATDLAGNSGSNATDPLVLFYEGPAPLLLDTLLPEVGYPEDRVRDPHPTRPTEFPGALLPTTTFTLTGSNLHRLVRLYAAAEEDARFPLERSRLFEAQIQSVAEDGTSLTAQLPATVWTGLDVATDRAMRWIIEDRWTRPGVVPWTLAHRFVARQRPWPMTHGFGFVNQEGPNTLTDFDGVFGLNAYLSWTDYCLRDPIYLGFFEWGYSATLNRAPGGSCFGMVAASQALYLNRFNSTWLNAGFYVATHLPAGRWEYGALRESNPSCGPRSPGSLWSWIQTFHGVQQSEEYLYQELDQIVRRSDVWRGNIGARLAQLGPRPYEYLLCIRPHDQLDGHCVLPYRIQPLENGITRVWVYDPNYPYNHFRPESHPANVRSVNSWVDFDPARNSFSFDLGADYNTNNAALVSNHYRTGPTWTGEGLTVALLPEGRRSMPGLGYRIDRAIASVTGDARPEYRDSNGKRWGWTADGKRIGEIDDLHPFTPYNLAGEPSDQVLLIAGATNVWDDVTVRATGTNYHFVTGANGVLFGAHQAQALPGDADQFQPEFENGQPRRLRIRTERAAPALVPFVVVPDRTSPGTNHLTWRWPALQLPAGHPVSLLADSATGTVGIHNEGLVPLTATLVCDRATETGPASMNFGALDIPAGGAMRFTLIESGATPRLREASDPDGDGVFQSVTERTPVATPPKPRLMAVKADPTRRRLRLRLEGAAPSEVRFERSADLLQWEPLETEASERADEVEAPWVNDRAVFFRMHRLH